jgi:hypothetical protein
VKSEFQVRIRHDKPLPTSLFLLAEKYPEVFLDIEVWRPFPKYPVYEVSSLGNVRRVPGLARRLDGRQSFVRGGPIRLSRLPSGYLNWGPSVGGKQASELVHRAVAAAFYGPQPGLVVRHINGVRDDNRLLNLEWGTFAENEADKVRHGTAPRGERAGAAKLTAVQVAQIKLDGRSSALLAREYGVSPGQIWRIRSGRAWAYSNGCEVGVTATLAELPKEPGAQEK